jgi:hypothetical protein
MSEWFDNQKKPSSSLSRLLQKPIDRARPRRNLTTEETKRFTELEAIAHKL